MNKANKKNESDRTESAVLGGGCFWCLDAAYSHIKGVRSVEAGYAGGWLMNPTYQQVSNDETGHAEVVKIIFNPSEISYEDILHIFFTIHDPTTVDRQGGDIGPQYRSIILYADEQQNKIAQKVIREITKEKIWEDAVATEVEPLEKFYLAEEYHQKYFQKNPEQAYCQVVIEPKIAKLRKKYGKFFQ